MPALGHKKNGGGMSIGWPMIIGVEGVVGGGLNMLATAI